MSFFKNGGLEGKTGCVWGLAPVCVGEDIRKGCRRVNMVEYYVVMNENGKMRPVGIIPGLGGGIKGNDGGANSTMIYCKNFDAYQCHNVPPI
jgi:hypothetical protein